MHLSFSAPDVRFHADKFQYLHNATKPLLFKIDTLPERLALWLEKHNILLARKSIVAGGNHQFFPYFAHDTSKIDASKFLLIFLDLEYNLINLSDETIIFTLYNQKFTALRFIKPHHGSYFLS